MAWRKSWVRVPVAPCTCMYLSLVESRLAKSNVVGSSPIMHLSHLNGSGPEGSSPEMVTATERLTARAVSLGCSPCPPSFLGVSG
jgi:hypothetical protein